MLETTGEGKSAVATPDGEKPKKEEEVWGFRIADQHLGLLHHAEFQRCHLYINLRRSRDVFGCMCVWV